MADESNTPTGNSGWQSKAKEWLAKITGRKSEDKPGGAVRRTDDASSEKGSPPDQQ